MKGLYIPESFALSGIFSQSCYILFAGSQAHLHSGICSHRSQSWLIGCPMHCKHPFSSSVLGTLPMMCMDMSRLTQVRVWCAAKAWHTPAGLHHPIAGISWHLWVCMCCFQLANTCTFYLYLRLHVKLLPRPDLSAMAAADSHAVLMASSHAWLRSKSERTQAYCLFCHKGAKLVIEADFRELILREGGLIWHHSECYMAAGAFCKVCKHFVYIWSLWKVFSLPFGVLGSNICWAIDICSQISTIADL
jgi:hypothetical protein